MMMFCPSCSDCSPSETPSREQCPDISGNSPEGDVDQQYGSMEYKVILRDIGRWQRVSYKFRVSLLPEFSVSTHAISNSINAS